MKIVKSNPPNIADIRARFVLNDNVIFAYGDVIYNPGTGIVTDDLVAHEQTHQRQQGDDPEAWWKKYLRDDQFRLEQEIEAYSNQYNHYKENVCTKPSGKVRKIRLGKFLSRLAEGLSSPIYGGIVSKQEARELIKTASASDNRSE